MRAMKSRMASCSSHKALPFGIEAHIGQSAHGELENSGDEATDVRGNEEAANGEDLTLDRWLDRRRCLLLRLRIMRATLGIDSVFCDESWFSSLLPSGRRVRSGS